MNLGDRIRAFFSKKGNPGLLELEPFALERKGVEGYIEPRTPTSPTTLLLVDRDGDHLRAPVREPADAVAFCERLAIPVYDAQVIAIAIHQQQGRWTRRGPGLDVPLDPLAF